MAAPNGSLTPASGQAGKNVNDDIARFAAASRPMSPGDEHTLFHDGTKCFV